MNTGASILVYKFRPERTGFNMYAEYTQLQFTFFALEPFPFTCQNCIPLLSCIEYCNLHKKSAIYNHLR